jgi:uncharacterized protein
MAIAPPAKMLVIFIGESDKWGDPRIPLHEAIMEYLFESGIDGATANSGIMGYGDNRRLHKKGLFGVTDDRTITITVVDNESKLRAVLPRLKEMVLEGLIFLLEGEVLHQGLSQ